MRRAPLAEHRTDKHPRLSLRAWMLALALLMLGAGAETAHAQLSITPTTWNVIGLDSNKETDGPNVFPVGARVCNTSGAALNNVVANFVWDSSNIYLNITDTSTLSTRSLAAGACVDYYFNVTVTRSPSAYNNARRFHITASADGTGTVSTPTPRELYIEKLVSQSRNDIVSISGPTTVYVGNTYQYTVNATTAPGGYEQLEAFLHLSNIIFQVQAVSTTYSTPTGATNNKVYADACGWDNNPLSASYRSCIGPANYSGGKAGDTISTTYTVKVLSTGTTVISSVVYDFSGSSYHYNGDFGQDTLSVTALDPPLTLSKSASSTTLVNGGTVTYTLRLTNSSSYSMTINDFVDTLPTSPASASYVSGSSTFNNVSIANPTISGSTLTWVGLFVVPAGQTRDLKFQATLPATVGTYVNSAVAHLEYTQIDTTSSISDNSPATASVQVILPTDLTISKTHTGNFTQGQNGTYTITVTNSGGVASSGTVTVTDTLPTGLTPGTATGTGWTCSTSSQTVTCTRSDALSGGASYPAISVPVSVASNSSLSLTNTASVSGGNDSNTGNNSSSDATTINGVPDLTISKSHTGNFTQGQTGASYTLTVTNAGGAATTGTVTVTDTLPASLTSPSGSGTGWTCNTSGQTVTCTRSTALAAGASYPTITITANVSATAPASVTNTASVSGGGETNTGNDSASDATTINQLADLTIAKSHTGNFTQGQNGATYTITVTNSGSGPTSGTVTVTDTVPASLTSPVGSGTGWTCSTSGQVVTCTRADVLAAGASYPTITLTVNVSATAPASVTNSVSVSGGGEIITNNDSASDATTINQLADLTISKTHTGNFTQGQTNASYTLTVTNSGNGATSGTVTVTDTLPTGLSYSSATGTGWSCSASGQTVTCTNTNTLNAGASYAAITLNVNVSATAPSSVTNTASVSGGGETNTGNDSASDATTINAVADMTVTKTHPGNFTRGSTGTYTITATNSGTVATNGTTVTVTDTLPAGLTPTTASGTGWSCSISSQTVTCTRTTVLGAGVSYPAISVTVSVAQNAASSLTNTASVSGGGQANTSNDTASDATTIVSSADLSLTKVTNNSGSGVGTNATFTVTLTNSGPSDATNVAVRDQLPSGLTYVSSTPSTGTYNSGTGVWSVASLASGASATLQIVARIDSLGAITNTAQVTASDQPDPDSTPNNNNPAEDDQASSSLNTSVPSVTLCKTIQGQPCPPVSTPSLPPGSDITYVITFTNTGGSYASSFVITDPIPANTDFKVGSVTTNLGTTGLTVTVAYSSNNGSTWTYTPVSGAGGAPAGYDRNVTHVRWTFGGNLSQTSPNNTGNVSFTVIIR